LISPSLQWVDLAGMAHQTTGFTKLSPRIRNLLCWQNYIRKVVRHVNGILIISHKLWSWLHSLIQSCRLNQTLRSISMIDLAGIRMLEPAERLFASYARQDTLDIISWNHYIVSYRKYVLIKINYSIG